MADPRLFRDRVAQPVSKVQIKHLEKLLARPQFTYELRPRGGMPVDFSNNLGIARQANEMYLRLGSRRGLAREAFNRVR